MKHREFNSIERLMRTAIHRVDATVTGAGRYTVTPNMINTYQGVITGAGIPYAGTSGNQLIRLNVQLPNGASVAANVDYARAMSAIPEIIRVDKYQLVGSDIEVSFFKEGALLISGQTCTRTDYLVQGFEISNPLWTTLLTNAVKEASIAQATRVMSKVSDDIDSQLAASAARNAKLRQQRLSATPVDPRTTPIATATAEPTEALDTASALPPAAGAKPAAPKAETTKP